MNAYVTVDLLKNAGLLNITGTTDDTRLRMLAEAVSRGIDAYCNRHFYVLAATRKFDGDGGLTLLIPDLVSVDSSGLKTDDNKDRTFESTWATTDYLLMPSNADPTGGHGLSRPYTKTEVDVDGGTKGVWTQGHQTVQIAGKWGWWQRTKTATETVNEALDATETGVDVSSRADIEAGHTILVDSEQMYVKSYSSNTLTVTRGVNGTTAATHDTASAIAIYEYPEVVVEAAIVFIARLWKRKDAAFADEIGMPDGTIVGFKRLDPDVRMMLSPLRKIALGVGV